MMPHVHTSVFLLLALLALAVAQPESSASYDEDAESAPYEDEGADGFLESNPHLQEMFGRLQRSVDADGLLRARRWGNIANGALLAATGPIALVVSVFGLKLSNIVLSLYVTAVRAPCGQPRPPTHAQSVADHAHARAVSQFGGLLAGIELGANPIAPWVRSNLQYLHTAPGRTALLAFLGGLTWPLGRMGLVPALLTCFNAVFKYVTSPLAHRSLPTIACRALPIARRTPTRAACPLCACRLLTPSACRARLHALLSQRQLCSAPRVRLSGRRLGGGARPFGPVAALGAPERRRRRDCRWVGRR
jgi:hypothetical protein